MSSTEDSRFTALFWRNTFLWMGGGWYEDGERVGGIMGGVGSAPFWGGREGERRRKPYPMSFAMSCPLMSTSPLSASDSEEGKGGKV